MKTLLLFIGTVLRSRVIQRKGLGAIPAIYKLILHWWTWVPPQPDSQVSAVAEQQGKSSGAAATRWGNPIAQGKALLGLS
jgi:hypothetical protein